MSKCSVHVLLTVARYGLQSTNPMLSFASLANNFKQSWKSNDQIIKSGRGEHHKFINYANSFKTAWRHFHPAGKMVHGHKLTCSYKGAHTLNIYYYRNVVQCTFMYMKYLFRLVCHVWSTRKPTEKKWLRKILWERSVQKENVAHDCLYSVTKHSKDL